MNISELVSKLSLEEKLSIITGADMMTTIAIEKYGIPKKRMADGPNGVRITEKENCTQFPAVCSLASTWDKESARKMGDALANDCIEHGIDMLLAPGINIKRHILCGRNFEYFSEDPVLAGTLAAEYINGLEERGVGTSLKHLAVNSQEKHRILVNADLDERTMREIYLKGFEIALSKSKP
ncbi:MAG: glycoside hydrolase family 3 protein, partial [Ruminococcaceae bacterium]|nr:glycoside hydrolase family 3 protein [Oscillospiraceae bacterium]